jgi:probable F420-dependent oxidoreductase
MMISAQLPTEIADFQAPGAIGEAATLLEDLGFGAGLVTDHPCPTARWLDSFGHYAPDPFVALSFAAAATHRLKLLTGVLVLPYRNPFITARAVSSLDVYCGGRLILGVATGYLRSEFNALGVNYERRNELTDEYLAALKAAWGAKEFNFEGSGYRASHARILPHPTQQPHPPIWVGGNSPLAIRRAVAFGTAWYPVFTLAQFSIDSNTQSITEDADLTKRIQYMREHAEKVGRARPPEVQVIEPPGGRGPWSINAMVDRLGKLQELGAAGVSITIDGTTRAEWRPNAEKYAEVFRQFPAARTRHESAA